MIIAIVIYAIAMTLANLSVAYFGAWVSPINSFLFIGLDLTLRDWLHTKLKVWQMACLIICSGLLTYVLNPSAGQIAVASAVSFTVAAMADWAAFAKLKGTWMRRANGSNVIGSAVDSVLFPTIAFGILMPWIVVMQFAAKIIGGAFWSVLISKIMKGRNGNESQH